MPPSRRLLVLLVILALVAGLVIFSPAPGVSSSARIVEANTAKRVSEGSGSSIVIQDRHEAAASTTLLALRDRNAKETPTAAAFVTHDWTPPPPPLPPPAPPLPPQAPPLPFTFIGKQIEAGEWIVFLANQDRTYAIKTAMLIESTYRVEKIAPPTLTLIYLPLQQQQTLAIGPSE